MAWESGGGFFKNIGNWMSGIGQGGGGFMGDFGTSEGALSKWQPFQNIAEGRGFFGKEGGFGSGEGQLSEMFKQQDVTGSDASANMLTNTPVGMPSVEQPVYGPHPEGSTLGSPGSLLDIALPTQDMAVGLDVPLESTAVSESTKVATPDDFLLTQQRNQHYGDDPDDPFWGPPDEHDKALAEFDAMSLEDQQKQIKRDKWKSRGRFLGQETLDYLKEDSAKILAANAAKAAAGSGAYQQPAQDPLRFYGGGEGYNFADVTGGGQAPQYNPLSQGLAGYYNPQLRDLR